MFDCGYKTQNMDGHEEKFVRLEESSPSYSFDSNAMRMDRSAFNIEGIHSGLGKPTKSFKGRVKIGSEGLKSLGKTLRFGSSKGVFQEDLKVSEKKIFDPQDQFLLGMNRLL
ncbi:hypothetical protein HPP92_011813 [Vanilla planifolia]|uniref:Uncharacterized protein n=1 Tax=Vanilla planifolia TaxID=51239 RepID=A0A835V1D3_VANPL|nr:hypothetical protein HPP92_011813 [Vanilla planifolia]